MLIDQWKTLTVRAEIDPKAALRAGQTRVGEVVLRIEEGDLATFTPAQREALAELAEGPELKLTEKLRALSLDEVARALLAQATREREQRDEREQRHAEWERAREASAREQHERDAAFLALSPDEARAAVLEGWLGDGHGYQYLKLTGEADRRQRAIIDAHREERAAAEQAAIDAWIEAHGSDRLKRCAREGIECTAIYRDERLLAERPGWQWYDQVPGETDDPRNPPADAFAVLDRARALEPQAKLQRYTVDHEHGDECCGDCPRFEVHAYVAEAEFLGRVIVFGVPA